jgi:hypothetical protein
VVSLAVVIKQKLVSIKKMDDDQDMNDIIAAVRAHTATQEAARIVDDSSVEAAEDNSLMEVLQSPHFGDLFGMILGDTGFKNIIMEVAGSPPTLSFNQTVAKVVPTIARSVDKLTGENFDFIVPCVIQNMGPMMDHAIANDETLVEGMAKVVGDSIK